jgi:hypothetical protein
MKMANEKNTDFEFFVILYKIWYFLILKLLKFNF